MNLTESDNIVARLHRSAWLGVIALTGGGGGLLSNLCRIAGASRTLLAGYMPYSQDALAEFIGTIPEQACSAQTARAMAMTAFHHAIRLNAGKSDTTHLFGFGATASLASTRRKRSDHRIHVAIQTTTTTATSSLRLVKGLRSRSTEEQLAADFCLHALIRQLRIEGPFPSLELHKDERPSVHALVAPETWQQVVKGKIRIVCHCAGRALEPGPDSSRIIFPGSFNPLHEGHLRIAGYASMILGAPVQFELCIRNIDKPPLDYQEIRNRLQAFPADSRIWLTDAPTFIEKARLLPGSTFLIGVDTLARIVDCDYYEKSHRKMLSTFEEIDNLQCRFMVFGRSMHGRFTTMKELTLPPEIASICRQVPEADFRIDVESRKLRSRQSHHTEPF